MSKTGRVYRRCACRGEDGKQLGARCPELHKSKHGTWTFAINVPTLEGKRKTMRRGGFRRKEDAQAALDKVRDRLDKGIENDDRQTLAEYLEYWLNEQSLERKPKTMLNYRRYVEQDIVPALGVIPLETLRSRHISRFRDDLQQAGRGPVTIVRILATLSSALNFAVESERLTSNPCKHVTRPETKRTISDPWNAEQTARFLRFAAEDRLGVLFEVIAGCGLRRGEALALRWSDVNFDRRFIRIERTLSDVGGRLVFGEPKTKGSKGTVAIPARVVEALRVQWTRQAMERGDWGEEAYEDHDLVFARENGAPLRPELVLRLFQSISKRAGLPPIRLHDLRHGAATLLISEGVPLAVVSKMLRHSKTSTTVDLYGHLTEDIAADVADRMGSLLDAATAEHAAETAFRQSATTVGSHQAGNETAGLPEEANPLVDDGAPVGIRTPNLLIRSQMLYPLSYGRIVFSFTRPGRAGARLGRTPAEAPGFEPGRGRPPTALAVRRHRPD